MSEKVHSFCDNKELDEQLKAYDSLPDKDRLDYFCAVLRKVVDILSFSDKNVFESVVCSLNLSPRYHKQLLNAGLILLFNNIWTHEQLVILCRELLEYNESFVCNTGNDLSDHDLSDFILSRVKNY